MMASREASAVSGGRSSEVNVVLRSQGENASKMKKAKSPS